MWNWVGKLFGTDKAIDKTIDTVSQGLDKLVYTSEEKAEDIAKDRSEARKMIIEWMANTQGQNLARRLLALIITCVWLLMYLLSAGMDISIVWVSDPELINNITSSAKVIGERATEMNGAMMLILGFYFAAPHMDKLISPAMKKFGGRSDAS